MLQISEKHLEKFRQINQHFQSRTEVPKKNKWQSLTNNDIWLHVFAQVMVVGRSEPYKKFNRRVDLKREVAFDSLIEVEDDREVKRRINKVLREVGTRYASSDISKCKKTNALVHNLRVFRHFKGGPKGFLTELSKFSSDKLKIDHVKHSLKYIKNKGARDFLMELGLVRDALAFDSRIKNLLQKIGVETPEHFEINPKQYDEVENDILSEVCATLGISGVELDRMLYQNYEEIMRMKL
jgi:hypothetical protein